MLLEVLIAERDPSLKDTVQVGKIKKLNNFKEYIGLCSQKASLELKTLTEAEIERVGKRYAEVPCYIFGWDLFQFWRVIILDRLLYLREHGL